MKQFLISCILIGFWTTVAAQPFTVSLSPTFEEPREAGTRVFQCENGNTLLLGFLPNGLRVIVYNASRKPGSRSVLTPATWGGGPMKNAEVKGIFDFGPEVVLFVRTLKGDVSVLSRLSISSADGRLLSYATLAEGRGDAFFVQKAPDKDAYSVAKVSYSSRGKQIVLRRFDDAHNQTGKDSFAVESRFKQINCLGFASKAPGEGLLCFYEYNTQGSAGKESRFEVISFKNGKLKQTTIDSAKELRATDAYLLYNRNADLYEIVTATAEGSAVGFFPAEKNEFTTRLIGIRAKDFKLAFAKAIDESELDAASKERFGKGQGYSGLPVNAVAGADGSLTVMTESLALSLGENNTSTSYLGHIGLMKFDSTGTPIAAMLIPNNKEIEGSGLEALYQKGEDVSTVWINKTANGIYPASASVPGYFYSRLVATPGGSFVFTNQHEGDFDHDLKKAPTLLKDISSANAVGYSFDAGAPKAFHLFGKPGENFEHRFALFSSGDYSPKTRSFAVVIVEKKKREEPKARIAWLQSKDVVR